MDTYLFIDIKTKKALIHLAEVKQLSLSTTAGIIINNLHPVVETFYKDNYIQKGEKQLHIKVKNKHNYKITSITATNCIYCYFNKPVFNGQKINWNNKYIQSELDRTEDHNRNKNIEIRIAYRLKAGKF